MRTSRSSTSASTQARVHVAPAPDRATTAMLWRLALVASLPLLLWATLNVHGGEQGEDARRKTARAGVAPTMLADDEPAAKFEAIPVEIERENLPSLVTFITPLGDVGGAIDDTARGPGGPCPQQMRTHSSATFGGGSFVIQAGFVENEIAAASFTLDPSAFPIIFNAAEMILARQTTNGQITTQWSIIVWEGTPTAGSIVYQESSLDGILPPVIMSPGTQGVNVNVVVDPQDPEQIVINDNGSATFTIGYRIDEHNDPPANPCGAPSQQSNAFPTTDTGGLQATSQNWLYCLPGCSSPPLGCTGWNRFVDLGVFVRPSGDWNIRVTYTPFTCNITGACCVADGTCLTLNSAQCASQDGFFYGDGTSCATTTCPDPVGACCFYEVETCTPDRTEAQCGASAGVWLGAGTTCGANTCVIPVGACCFQPSGCADLTEADCTVAGGAWGGASTNCATHVCNPTGACCLPNGSCDDAGGAGVSPAACSAMGGVFQGHASLCSGVSCPVPRGACCLSNGSCLTNQTEANCVNIPNASWAGAETACVGMDGGPGACAMEEPCAGDLSGSSGSADGSINVFDLLELLSAWGTAGSGADLADPTDTVNVFDLLELLSLWGPCP